MNNAQLTIDQIIAINTTIADYIVQTPELTNNDQFYDCVVSKDIPQSTKNTLGSWCFQNRLYCTFTFYKYENTHGYRVAIWSYNYIPKYQIH
jgi:hypothetical protein